MATLRVFGLSPDVADSLLFPAPPAKCLLDIQLFQSTGYTISIRKRDAVVRQFTAVDPPGNLPASIQPRHLHHEHAVPRPTGAAVYLLHADDVPPGNRPGTRVGTDPVPTLPDLRPLQDVALFRFEFVAVPFSGRPDPAGSHVVTCLALQGGPYRNMARTAAHVDAFCPALSGAAPSELPRPRITAMRTTCEERHPFRVRTASVRCQK